MTPAESGLLLVLDASSGGEVAVLRDGVVLASRSATERMGLAGALPGMMQAVLEGLVPDCVAVCIGPGSFTGLRAALSLAQGYAMAAGCPLVPVTLAEAFAATLPDGPAVWTVLETGRGHLFLDRGEGFVAIAVAEVAMPEGPVRLAGDAAAVLAGRSAVDTGVRRPAMAAFGRVAARRLAGELAPLEALPLYVDPPATT